MQGMALSTARGQWKLSVKISKDHPLSALDLGKDYCIA